MENLAAIAATDRAMSGYARYVGRIGGLAFALGVGTAVLTGTGVAWADTTDSGTGGSEKTSASSSSSQRSDTAPRPAKSKSKASKPKVSKSKSESESSKPKVSKSKSESEESKANPKSEASVAKSEAESDPTETVSEAESVAPAGNDQDVPASPEARQDVVARTDSHPTARAADVVEPTKTPSAVPAATVNSDPFFDNQTPTLAYDSAENKVVDGRIEGNLHPVDPDSTKLTYTTTKPANGTVVINPNGTFAYTPGPNYPGQDRFDVTVSDAYSGFHIHGFSGLLNLLSFGLLGTSGHKTTETVFVGVNRAVVASGLDSPVDFRFLPDGRILIAEKGGAIKVVQPDGTVLAQPLITLSVNTVGERGISGLAVDPQFATNGHVYVAYTTSAIKDRLSQFTVVGNTADPDSEKLLLETTETVATIHHGGALAFGADGTLYWGKGDNGTGSNAQDLTNIFGKILRLNPDGSTPSDNPALPGALPQIYAYGLRNPFRLTFTPDGRLLVADVGNVAFEELNLVTAGGNYGWPGAEGLCTSNCTGLTNPIYTYAHGSGAAFASVLVYNDALFPQYLNKVFIADEVKGWIKVLTCNPTFTSCGDPQDFDPAAGTTVVLAQGPGTDGGIYQLTYDPGTLVRFAPTASPPPAAVSV
jgi:aldose sugar dehydrogenase